MTCSLKEANEENVGGLVDCSLASGASGEEMSVGLERFDHVAIEVAAFDDALDALVATGGLRAIRSGVMSRTGQRIVLVGDGTGVKIELMECADALIPRLAHIAFRCAEVSSTKRLLEGQGWKTLFGPHALAAAKAETALLENGQQLRVQIIKYENSSPDIVEWKNGKPEE